MARQSIFDMKVSKIYPLLLQKVERKGRSKEELDATIEWLTGYDMKQVDQDMTYGDEKYAECRWKPLKIQSCKRSAGWTSW